MLTLCELTYAPRGLGPISLTLTAGQVVLLCGPSGSGKSTVCALLTGELEPSSGRLERSDSSQGALCGYMAADVESQLLGATVAQELALGRSAQAAGISPARQLAAEALAAHFEGRGEVDPQQL